MPGQMERFEWVSKLARLALYATLGLILLAIFVTAAAMMMLYLEYREWFIFPLAALLMLAELIAGAWLWVASGVVSMLAAQEISVNNIAGRLGRIETLLDDLSASARKQVDLASLSDQAKSLLFRDREVEAIRETVHDAAMRQEYLTAEQLIEAVEKRLGYADEAARLRKELAASRKATLEEKIDAAVARIEQIIAVFDWPRAIRESQRIARLFPTNPKVAALAERIESARARHKRDLLTEYGEAVRKNDIDRGIELLKELDRYLTPQEGAALAESARGVFRAKLHNMIVQFEIRVTEGQWAEAVAVGEDIVRQYPNTTAAQQVRTKIDALRARAAAKTK
ncbi:MAG: hypothetical protein ACE15C_11255 [Phycisphaerae bacterium]